MKTDLLVPGRALILYRPTTTHTDDQGNVSVGNAETTPGSTPSPGQGIIDGVGADLSGDGNDSERRLSEVHLRVTDLAAADSHDTTQTLRQTSIILPHAQVNLSVGNAETNSGDTPSPSNSSHAAIAGVGANHRDASSSQNILVSALYWPWNKFLKPTRDHFTKPSYTVEEIIAMAARDYDLEGLRNGLSSEDEFHQRIDMWKEFEDRIVFGQIPPILIPKPLDYGEEWQVFRALQLWFYYGRHKETNGNGKFPLGYRTLYDSSEDEILRRSRQVNRIVQ